MKFSKAYSTEEVAKLFGCSARYVRKLCKIGKLQAKKIGRDWIVIGMNHGSKPKDSPDL